MFSALAARPRQLARSLLNLGLRVAQKQVSHPHRWTHKMSQMINTRSGSGNRPWKAIGATFSLLIGRKGGFRGAGEAVAADGGKPPEGRAE